MSCNNPVCPLYRLYPTKECPNCKHNTNSFLNMFEKVVKGEKNDSRPAK